MEVEAVNRTVVEVFGHSRYVYQLGYDGYVMPDFFHVHDVNRPSIIIVDPCRFGLDYGNTTRLCELRDEISTRQGLRFSTFADSNIHRSSFSLPNKINSRLN